MSGSWMLRVTTYFLFSQLLPYVIAQILLFSYPNRNVIQGVASTSMVARVALLAATNAARSGLVPVSGLDFVGESTNMTSTGIAGINQVTYMITRDPASDPEGDSTKESDLVRA